MPQFGFICEKNFKGDFDVAISQEYIEILNRFYKNIEEACFQTIKDISKRKNFSSVADLVKVASGKTDKGEWTTKRV